MFVLCLVSIVVQCGVSGYPWVRCSLFRKIVSGSRAERQVVQAYHNIVQKSALPDVGLLQKQQKYEDLIDWLPNTRYTLPLKRAHDWNKRSR